MKKGSIAFFVSPVNYSVLNLHNPEKAESEIISGTLTDSLGNTFLIKDGMPDFTVIDNKEKNEYAISLFDQKAEEYDKYQHLSFETFYLDETEVRNSMIDRLNLKDDSKVLEVNAGTGRDSVLIAKRLSQSGLLHVQDISGKMLIHCFEKLSKTNISFEIHQGNACKLPYPDKVFDAVYSFGGVGMNTYSNNRDALKELVRVTKIGGKVVFGGLSLSPWLRDCFFGKVLINHNVHYTNDIAFADFPVEAHNVNLSWILNGAGFVVDFTVGVGEPIANFDFEIPGPRGGTLLTRYLGNLEGVTLETKGLALKAREKLGISMHKWLDDIIRRESENIISGE